MRWFGLAKQPRDFSAGGIWIYAQVCTASTIYTINLHILQSNHSQE